MNINNFRGDLTDISAKKKALVYGMHVLKAPVKFLKPRYRLGHP